MEVVSYSRELLDSFVELYNREGAFSSFISHLDERTFERHVAAKAFFDPESVFLATAGGRVAGAVFTTFCPREDGEDFHPSRGAVAGLFFPRSRPAVGDALLARALSHLEIRGSASVEGSSPRTGYPFWRDLYCGSEPVLRAEQRHVAEAFSRAGFSPASRAAGLLAEIPSGLEASSAAGAASRCSIYNRPAENPTFWDKNSWLGLWPMVLEAKVEGFLAGRLGWCELPATSRRRGVRTAGIYHLRVEPQFRRRGVATALVARLFEEAARDGASEVLVACERGNRAALRVYRKSGFHEVFGMVGMHLVSL